MATAEVLPILERERRASDRAIRPKQGPSTIKPQTIDEAAKMFLALKLQQKQMDEMVDKAKASLLAMVERYGRVPAKADKSKRVSGLLYEITATYGTSTSVDTAAAEQIMTLLIDAGMEKKAATALFESLFIFQPKYSLAPTALKTIAKLPKGAPRNLRALFDRAVKVTPKSPTISVMEKGQ